MPCGIHTYKKYGDDLSHWLGLCLNFNPLAKVIKKKNNLGNKLYICNTVQIYK